MSGLAAFRGAGGLTLGLGAVVVCCMSANVHAEATDRLSRTVAFTGKPIRVDVTIGELTIVGSDRQDVVVEVVRHAPAADDLATFPAAVTDAVDALHITVTQARDLHDARLRSEVVVRAPSSAVFDPVHLFEGRIQISGVTGGCNLDLQRGAIEATGVAGRVRLEAGVGSVDVKDPELTPGGMMRLRVFNGPLRVRLARPPANARILAVVLNGGLTSEIPLNMKNAFGPRFGETTLGNGDPVMSLDVVKGDISIGVGAR